MIVTDIETTNRKGEKVKGFYMDGYLAYNLLGITNYLKKDYDCVGIISGHGKVRVGKSTIAFQVGTLVSWLIAGGKMDVELVKNEDGSQSWKIKSYTSPNKKINWSLEENVVFSAKDLKKTAWGLYNKYGKNQVIIYDEGRQGLAANRAMENLNKEMEDFFQECGFMGHVILIVLPNFFKLHEDYAVARSLFLIDAFTDKKKRKGYFNFYDETQKEWLYFLGRKMIGITQKYLSANESFWGRFTQWFPFDKVEYEKMKLEAMKKKEKTRAEKRWHNQRNAMMYILNEEQGLSCRIIAEKLEKLTNEEVSTTQVIEAVDIIRRKVKKKEENAE